MQPTNKHKYTDRIAEIARGVLDGRKILRHEAMFLLRFPLEQLPIGELLYWANRIRLARFGPKIALCAIASVRTGRCSEDCRFCTQSSHFSTHTKPQSMAPDQLLTAAEQACSAGAGCFGLVSSGRGPTNEDIECLVPVITSLAHTGRIQCAASLGCLTYEQAQRLYDLGLRRYHHNLETSPHYFPNVVTTHTYNDRLDTVNAARRAGLRVCCGGIIGLGESIEDRVDLAFALRDLNVDSIPLNFLNPIPGTPFADREPVPALTALRTIAMFRFVLPDRHLTIAGGREKCLHDLQSWIFFAGAGGVMIGNYLTTSGRDLRQDLQMLHDLNLPLQDFSQLPV